MLTNCLYGRDVISRMDKLWTGQAVAFPAICKQHSAGDREKAGVKGSGEDATVATGLFVSLCMLLVSLYQLDTKP